MRYFDAKKEGTLILRQAGIEEAEVDSEYLLLKASGIERSSLFVKLFETIPEKEYHDYLELLERRSRHEPLQHIIGSQIFMGYTFFVSTDVLIPRFDTEILAELAVKRCLEQEVPDLKVLDLCTGSGCVAISVGLGVLKEEGQKEFKGKRPGIEVIGTDISESALKLSLKNLEFNLAEAKDYMEKTDFSCKFFKSDLFNSVEGKFNIITANPPYIVRDEIDTLMPEITEHEPRLALDGGPDGMDFYRRIVKEAGEYLLEDGRLLMEFDDLQAEPVKKMMLEAGFRDVEVHKDLAGLNRVIEGRV